MSVSPHYRMEKQPGRIREAPQAPVTRTIRELYLHPAAFPGGQGPELVLILEGLGSSMAESSRFCAISA